MLPTLRSGEVALVPRQETWLNRLGYGGVKAGDIVFFRSPLERNKHFIKRIIATSGERIRIVEGIVYLNGRLVREPYLGSIIVPTNLPETEIAPGNVFVLGDNRRPLGSLDSRHFGQIPFDSIGGRVAIILWPPFVIIDKRLRRNFRVLN
jgi:signal peptidase I